MAPKSLPKHNLVVVGGGGVGKSCLTLQLIRDTFVDEYDPTIEDSYRKQCIVDDKDVLLDVLDTAGQEEYLAPRLTQYMRIGEGFLLVYSIASKYSFEYIKTWQQQILKARDEDHLPIILVGNKCDLEGEREVSTEEGKQLAHRFACGFVETSAKSNINVENAFYDLVREVEKHKHHSARGAGSAEGSSGTPDKGKSAQVDDREAGGSKCAVM